MWRKYSELETRLCKTKTGTKARGENMLKCWWDRVREKTRCCVSSCRSHILEAARWGGHAGRSSEYTKEGTSWTKIRQKKSVGFGKRTNPQQG